MDHQQTTHPIKTVNGVAFIYWLPSMCFILHTIEELPLFASWVTKHFGPYTTEHFVITHIPLIWLGIASSYYATIKTNGRIWKILCIAWQWQFGLNAIFHLTTAVLFKEYSPGMLTAGAINLPATGYILYFIDKHKLITKKDMLIALIIGTIVAVSVIATLF